MRRTALSSLVMSALVCAGTAGAEPPTDLPPEFKQIIPRDGATFEVSGKQIFLQPAERCSVVLLDARFCGVQRRFRTP